ncbi:MULTISPECIES: hypothetical protein [Agrobacterium]|uniref:hypothetical protein n=1 Tax=Agrobacterium tumefaciens TaxID=358 RepID=UPI00157475D5|nr:hypothetical protein [Agrobacterium tumefaciens]NSZ06331.1 hypothetical protein [Agrobacterium tumefaciens]
MIDKKPKLEKQPKSMGPTPSVNPCSVIDPSRNLHVAISRAEIERDRIIAPEVELRKTYAHAFAHPMLATSPPVEENTHHPAPWHVISAPGVVETATVEMVLSPRETNSIDRLGHARNVVSLIRLLAGSPVHAPVYSDIAFSEMATAKGIEVWQFEAPIDWSISRVKLDDEMLAEIETMLVPLQTLLRNEGFNSAFRLADAMWWLPTLDAQMVAIWTASEALMKPDRNDMTKQLARLIRAYSGVSRQDGDNCYQRVISLCRARGEAVHAGVQPRPQDVQESYYMLRRLLLRALAEGAVPGRLETITPVWQHTAKKGQD